MCTTVQNSQPNEPSAHIGVTQVNYLLIGYHTKEMLSAELHDSTGKSFISSQAPFDSPNEILDIPLLVFPQESRELYYSTTS